MVFAPLIDNFGRLHNNLRLSVTDRCNIRCFYCMPEEVKFQPREQLLTFEEIVRFVSIAARLGIQRLRITGGEPLVRSGLSHLVQMLVNVQGIEDVGLTTNGIVLAEQAAELREAGLQRLNISLDTLKEETFFRIARRKGLNRVLAGIEAAKEAGFEKIRLNAIAIRDLTEPEIIPLVHFARQHDLELRFIEFMPLDADQNWDTDQVLSGQAIREIIEDEFGLLQPVTRTDHSQPAVDYAFADHSQSDKMQSHDADDSCNPRIGFINPVSEPFCATCSRLRLTSEGQVRNCLFATDEWDARQLLRNGATDEQLANLIRHCVLQKRAAHGIDEHDFARPHRAMYQIGG